MGSKGYCHADDYRGRRASKELYLPVLPGAWALGDGVDVHLLEEYCGGRSGHTKRPVSPPAPCPARQSGSGSPSVWSSLLGSLTDALDLSGGWEYSRRDSNRLAPRGGSAAVSAGGAVALSSGRGGEAADGVDGVVLVTSSSQNDASGRGGARRATGSALLHRSCSTSVVHSVAAVTPAAMDAPVLLGRTTSGTAAAAAAAAAPHYALCTGGTGGCSGSGSRSAATSARTSACGLQSTATISGLSSAATSATGMATPAAGRSARSSGSGCTGAGATPVAGSGTFDYYLACLPASGCAERDHIDSVLASPLGGGVPAQVSVRKQD
ncbi:hypothetical protein HYH02_007908 [Chlamydomonas schloesseri]|uniref:Uncharacterized protein n=1 Tax=Chlamydomonas schloesseri TaxID=2026947 RepID=A0A835WGM6_9CHLO|nr:hypothetical protein HYH02_007908 [Chlamydomonas schloesseri]|eukprot:KAG2447162.1 hypothetical protein HYH02_007908 [Chlamydomonas schloesseri]